MDRPASDDIVAQIQQRAERLDRGLFGIGVEILPYELIAVITDVNGTVLTAPARVDLVSMKVEAVVARIAQLARDLVAAKLGFDLLNARLCMGVELGGPVDSETGIVRFYANNPHDRKRPWAWKEVDLADQIQKATGCITVLENDAHAHAVYEQKLGVGQRSSSFALVLIRHGVGVGVVINGELLPVPAEFGHLSVVVDHGRECDCGRKGAHVESLAGRRAIPSLVAKKTGLAEASFERSVELANGTQPKAVHALDAFDEAGNSIARCIASILTIFGTPHVVIYGPESLVIEESGRVAKTYMGAVRTFADYTFEHLGNCEITTKALEPERGAVGAALTALNRHFSVPLEPSLEPVR